MLFIVLCFSFYICSVKKSNSDLLLRTLVVVFFHELSV